MADNKQPIGCCTCPCHLDEFRCDECCDGGPTVERESAQSGDAINTESPPTRSSCAPTQNDKSEENQPREMSSLLPCPFCGAESNFCYVVVPSEGIKTYGVSCVRCACRKDGFEEKEEAANAWNSRTTESVSVSQLARNSEIQNQIDDSYTPVEQWYASIIKAVLDAAGVKYVD